MTTEEFKQLPDWQRGNVRAWAASRLSTFYLMTACGLFALYAIFNGSVRLDALATAFVGITVGVMMALMGLIGVLMIRWARKIVKLVEDTRRTTNGNHHTRPSD